MKSKHKVKIVRKDRTRRKRMKLVFIGSDADLEKLNSIDRVSSMSYLEKLAAIYQLTLFDYQVRNATDDVPRLLRTTACIRRT